jgi:hypothetical protein
LLTIHSAEGYWMLQIGPSEVIAPATSIKEGKYFCYFSFFFIEGY